MSQDKTKQIQQCEIEILQQIDKICQKHGLVYFGIGGTALGAVRHKGFIPWDDDIDIGMPRKDYEIFLKVASKELPAGFHVQHYDTEPETPFYFTKIRKDNTQFVEYYLRDQAIHHGIFVDIFPFDAIPDCTWQRVLHYRVSRLLYQLYLCKSLNTICSSRFEQRGEYKKTYKHYVRKIIHTCLLPIPKSWIFHGLDRCVRMFNNKKTNQIGHIVRKRLVVSNDVLFPIKVLPFDMINMPVPGDCDTYLTHQFGNYMKIPPKDKQYGHLPYLVELESGVK